MKNWRVTCIIVAMAVVAIVFAALYGNAVRETSSAPLKTVAATNVGEQLPGSLPSAELPDVSYARGLSLLPCQKSEPDSQEQELVKLEGPLQDFVSAEMPDVPYERGPSFLPTQKSEPDSQERELAKLESPLQDSSPDPTSPKQDFAYLTYYAYAEVLPDKKPADTVLEALRGIPVGTLLKRLNAYPIPSGWILFL